MGNPGEFDHEYVLSDGTRVRESAVLWVGELQTAHVEILERVLEINWPPSLRCEWGVAPTRDGFEAVYREKVEIQ